MKKLLRLMVFALLIVAFATWEPKGTEFDSGPMHLARDFASHTLDVTEQYVRKAFDAVYSHLVQPLIEQAGVR